MAGEAERDTQAEFKPQEDSTAHTDIAVATDDGASQYPTGIKLVIIMSSLMLGTTLMALDTTIISVATPRISTHFQSLDDVGWYGAAYLMTLTAFTPIASNFYKNFNPKYVYLAFIAVFEVGSVVCASAPTSPAFITGRAIAGLGAAGLLQGAFGILTYVCTLGLRPLFLALVVSLFGLFSSIGPLVGGALTERVTWRWCFWLNLPIGGAVVILVILFLTLHGVDQSTREATIYTKLKRLDLPGIVLLLASVSCLFLALQEGGVKVPWSSSKPICLLVGFGLLMILFAAWQIKAGENATIPVRYLKNRTVLWGSIYLLFDNMANYIPIYYIPFYFQAGLGHSPLKSAVDFIALAVPQMVGLLAGGGITTATGHYVGQMPVILVAQVMCGIGSGLLTTLRYDTRTVLWGTYLALTGLGLGLGVNIPHIAIQAVMPTDNDIFIANGIASFYGQIGGAIGIPIANALLIDSLHSQVPEFALDVASEDVVRNGALNLEHLTRSPSILRGLRQAYAIAISHVCILLVVVVCVSIPVALGMEWLNIKKVSQQREEEKKAAVQGTGVGEPEK
ncbi:MAG: hypothetical protein Q9174_005149 [Haloplaca sp. 1 TL-2023]